MSRKPDAWMPLYISDYLGDTTHLSTEQHGAYILLLMAAWKRGGYLPEDDEQLMAITRLDAARWRKSSRILRAFFSVSDGLLVQRRLAEEYAEAVRIHDAQKANGAKGGRPKKEEKPMGFDSLNPQANPDHNPQKTPSPSPVKASETIVSGASADPIFGTGLAFLKRKGVPDKSARSLLGKLRKSSDDVTVGALLYQAEAQDISDPCAWLMAAVKRGDGKPAPRPEHKPVKEALAPSESKEEAAAAWRRQMENLGVQVP